MDPQRRDRTDEWRLPAEARPPTVVELVGRIDEALATARSSEAAVMTVGAAALDAAEQARRAAELAERASAAVFSFPPHGRSAGSPADRPGPRTERPEDQASLLAADPMDDFSARADRVAERLRRLQRISLSA